MTTLALQKVSFSRIKHFMQRSFLHKLAIRYYPDDIFLVSYPKSGNTWLRFLIANYITGNRCDFLNSHLIIPDIHFNPEQFMKVERPRFIKSHEPYKKEYSKVIYLVRDGRDVAVSYYFHLIKYGKISQETEFTEFLVRFNSGCLNKFTSWSDHVKSWLTQKNSNFLLVRYEDLKKNPDFELLKILKFANVSIDFDAITSAVEASNFERMKNLEKEQHHLYKGFINSDPNIPFIRTGEIGESDRFFTDEMMKIFIKKHGFILNKLAYL